MTARDVAPPAAPAGEQIPYGRQHVTDADVAAVVEVLRSDWLTQGPAVERFERAMADRCGAPHAVAVSNATAALHLACRALGVGAGDAVWTSPNSFVASANCARYCDAEVDFVDVDPRTYNMSADALEAKLAEAERLGTLPRVIIPVHFAGQPCDMERIGALARRHGCAVIEDASHAVGATRTGTTIGDCAHSDAVVFSFHPVKVLTTGEGGMVLTRRREVHDALALLRSHGITRDPERMHDASHGPWYYQQVDLGYNYRITDLQCALGLAQAARLDDFLARRRELAARYDALLAPLPVERPWQDPAGQSAWHLYVVRVRDDAGATRREVVERMRAAGVGVNVHYIPIHTQPYYRARGFRDGDYPEAERYYAGALSLPMYYGLTDAQQERVVATLREALS